MKLDLFSGSRFTKHGKGVVVGLLYRDVPEREAKIRRLVDSNIIGILISSRTGEIIEMKNTRLKELLHQFEGVINKALPLVAQPPLAEVRKALLFEFPYAQNVRRRYDCNATVGVGPGDVTIGPRQRCRMESTMIKRDDGRKITRRGHVCN